MKNLGKCKVFPDFFTFELAVCAHKQPEFVFLPVFTNFSSKIQLYLIKVLNP